MTWLNWSRMFARRADIEPLNQIPTLLPVFRQRLEPGSVFTPTRPKTGGRFSATRRAELSRIVRSLREDHAHVVLYAERGRGKTSLANMVVAVLRRDGLIVARHTCEAGSNFDNIIRGLLADLPPALLASPAPAEGAVGCEAALPNRSLHANDLLAIPSRLTCRSLICVVDEFDRVQDSSAKTKLADAIKQISDADVPLRFLLVGVSNNLDEILGQHPSIQRNVHGVPLSLLTDKEVAELLVHGGIEVGVGFGPDIVKWVAWLARGMPYMVQLMALRLIQTATERGATEISYDDWRVVIDKFLAEANPRVLSLLSALTRGGRDTEMVHALWQIVQAPQDRLGRMAAIMAEDLVWLGESKVSAACWNRCLEAGAIVPVQGEAGLFTFADRWLMHYVLAAGQTATGEFGRHADGSLVPRFASRADATG